MNFLDSVYSEKERPQGEVTIKPIGRDGTPLKDPLSIFSDRTLAESVCRVNSDHSIDVGDNLVVNSGRQIIANLLGGKGFSATTPNKDWVISKISFGTYDEAPRFTDVSLSPQPVDGKYQGGENEIAYNGQDYKKRLTSVDWPAPFIVRFEAILGTDEGNGFLIREAGLWTDSEILFARKAFPPIAKTEDFAISLLWRVRS